MKCCCAQNICLKQQRGARRKTRTYRPGADIVCAGCDKSASQQPHSAQRQLPRYRESRGQETGHMGPCQKTRHRHATRRQPRARATARHKHSRLETAELARWPSCDTRTRHRPIPTRNHLTKYTRRCSPMAGGVSNVTWASPPLLHCRCRLGGRLCPHTRFPVSTHLAAPRSPEACAATTK
jgi:hypothetical protein